MTGAVEVAKVTTGQLGGRFENEAGIYLESFHGYEPDLHGWASVWQQLAFEAELVEESVREQDGALVGEFSVGSEGVTVGFEISDEGYLLRWNDEAATSSHGQVDFRSSISFAARESDRLGDLYGAVQLRPREGQVFHREGPVGHGFYLGEAKSNSTTMMPAFNGDGTYGLKIAPYDESKAGAGGSQEAAYDWYYKLKAIEQAGADD
ncbi:hypothetical protein Pla86_48970 [Planctomycetes bacterium Pla86]|uniref:Uncharacterized protein n=1 Tax=Engelhardtia mirabilis TaxID=2528011 RepID=A0A518BS28_9BACT|nr:hypothetical protein Pla133_48990 [Planctomycetes bacterium Pla133]QDV04103.1 hypothetical protein Pla86_48970 [Planctomycetes bacterium Pla86]